jgi:nucleotide-binding universal stress UspA family protein
MKNILLLTEFSDNSINAIHYALKLFSGDSCNFFVLHVETANAYLSDDLMAAGNQSIYDSLVKKPKDKLAHLTTQLKRKAEQEDFNIEMLIDHDGFIDAIKQVTKAKEIELIVMGTNGVTGAKEVVFGSNTINVIRKVDCPTLVIPEAFEYQNPEQILLPLDFQDALDSDAFHNVLDYVKNFGKKLHLVRINSDIEDSKESQKDETQINISLDNLDHEYHMVNNIPMPHVVDSYVQINNIDLITLLVQRESLFERFFIGSTTSKISNKLRVPLLVFHS